MVTIKEEKTLKKDLCERTSVPTPREAIFFPTQSKEISNVERLEQKLPFSF